MTDPTLREKLRLIRDSDHPASPWARNVMQCMDELKNSPDNPVLLRALGKNVVLLEREMHSDLYEEAYQALPTQPLTPAELASIFGLGRHQ